MLFSLSTLNEITSPSLHLFAVFSCPAFSSVCAQKLPFNSFADAIVTKASRIFLWLKFSIKQQLLSDVMQCDAFALYSVIDSTDFLLSFRSIRIVQFLSLYYVPSFGWISVIPAVYCKLRRTTNNIDKYRACRQCHNVVFIEAGIKCCRVKEIVILVQAHASCLPASLPAGAWK